MADVDTHMLASKLSLLETRVERIERERIAELERQNERARRRSDLLWHLTLFGMLSILAVVLSVLLTLAATGN